jgi:hypothetical protein
MSVVVVSTFMNLGEAQIAAGALASGGLHPLVMDQGYGSVNWIAQFGLQGFRLAVPRTEAADAVAYLGSLPRPRVRPRRPAKTVSQLARRHGWRVPAALLLPFPQLAWLVVGMRRRHARGYRSDMAIGMLLAAMAVPAVFAAVFLMLRLSDDLAPVLPLLAAIIIAVLGGLRGGRQSEG